VWSRNPSGYRIPQSGSTNLKSGQASRKLLMNDNELGQSKSLIKIIQKNEPSSLILENNSFLERSQTKNSLGAHHDHSTIDLDVPQTITKQNEYIQDFSELSALSSHQVLPRASVTTQQFQRVKSAHYQSPFKRQNAPRNTGFSHKRGGNDPYQNRVEKSKQYGSGINIKEFLSNEPYIEQERPYQSLKP
jgi:hypothetical protein